MGRVGRVLFVLPWLASLFAADSLLGQLVRVGGELQVNAHTLLGQRFPSVGLDGDGDFVVVWESYDGSGLGIIARRFSAAGVPVAVELQVNAYTTNSQELPEVAVADQGSYVVSWVSLGKDGSDFGIFARRFDATGTPLADEFQVNTYTANRQYRHAAATGSDGSFIIVWESPGQDGSAGGIFARQFDAAGMPVAVEFQVNSHTASDQSGPAIDLDSESGFVVAWSSNDQDGLNRGIFARRFDSVGAPQATELLVNSYYNAELQGGPAVALDGTGNFVVTWESFGQDGSGRGVFARRFDSSGTAQTGEIQVNSYTTGNQYAPAVADGGAGDFVVLWTSDGQDNDETDLFVRHFDAAMVQSAELQVNSFTADDQYRAAVASNGEHKFVVVWESYGQTANGSAGDIFAQRFATLATLDIDGDGTLLPLTDGLLVLRYAFGFSSDVLVSGAVNLQGCTRCDASAIEAYLDGID